MIYIYLYILSEEEKDSKLGISSWTLDGQSDEHDNGCLVRVKIFINHCHTDSILPCLRRVLQSMWPRTHACISCWVTKISYTKTTPVLSYTRILQRKLIGTFLFSISNIQLFWINPHHRVVKLTCSVPTWIFGMNVLYKRDFGRLEFDRDSRGLYY